MGNRTSIREAERLAWQTLPFVTAGTLCYEFDACYPSEGAFVRDSVRMLREAGEEADGIVSYLTELAEDDELGGIAISGLIGSIADYIARRKAELGKAV